MQNMKETEPQGFYPMAAPRFEMVPITVEMALNLLAGQVNIRPISKSVVERYARDMRNGNWKLSGYISTTSDGVLLNGFHRLHAVIESGTSTLMIRYINAPADTLETEDGGAKRTFAHVLNGKGVISAGKVAAMAAAGWKITNGQWNRVEPTNAEKAAWLEARPHAHELVKLSDRIFKMVKGKSSCTGAVMAEAVDAGWDLQSITAFVDDVVSGVTAFPGNPAIAYRNAMTRALVNSNTHLDKSAHRAYFAKALDAYLQGRQLSKLSWRGPTTSRPEPMPRITPKTA